MPPKKVAPVEEPKIEDPQTVIVIGFDAETKQLIRALTEALANRPAPIINLTASPAVPDMRPTCNTGSSLLPAPAPAPAPSTPAVANKPEASQTEETPKTTLTQIRNSINAKVEEGKTTAIVALLGNYGAKNASTLSEEYFDAFYKDLLTL